MGGEVVIVYLRSKLDRFVEGLANCAWSGTLDFTRIWWVEVLGGEVIYFVKLLDVRLPRNILST